jgi:hypothetical protein
MGLMRYILKEKLKGLKGVLKVWNKEVYEWVDFKIQQNSNKINSGKFGKSRKK